MLESKLNIHAILKSAVHTYHKCMLLGGSRHGQYIGTTCAIKIIIIFYKWHKSVIFSCGSEVIESLPYCSCKTDFVRCHHDGMTNSIQKGWKQLKYWIPHSLVCPPLRTITFSCLILLLAIFSSIHRTSCGEKNKKLMTEDRWRITQFSS